MEPTGRLLCYFILSLSTLLAHAVDIPPSLRKRFTNGSSSHPRTRRAVSIDQQSVTTFKKLPLSFEANNGQFDATVKFLSRGAGYTLLLTSTGAVFSLRHPASEHTPPLDGTRHRSLSIGPELRDALPYSYDSKLLRMQLAGASSNPAIRPRTQLPWTSNYFGGSDPSLWRTAVPNYAEVEYRDVYPGVDMVLHGNQRELEYDFVVAPNRDTRCIKLDFPDVAALDIDSEGSLLLGFGNLKLRKPVVYQLLDGTKSLVNAKYSLSSKTTVGFEIGEYDRSKPLVIDPSLSYSTYLGGSGEDRGFSLVVDASSNAYVIGETASTDFATQTPFQSSNNGAFDVFVAKLNATGDALVYSTFLGGTNDDIGTGIAVDSAGNAYITGQTNSSNFPVVNAFQSTKHAATDAFISKLNATGSALVYSTYLGGGNTDSASAIAIDSAGNAYVAGITDSSDFPVKSAIQTTSHGNQDAFISKLTAAGSALVYSTYLGGNDGDLASAIAVDGSGNAYVTGSTFSPSFPTTKGTFDTTCACSGEDFFYYYAFRDAWAAKITAGGTLAYSTFLGGNADDIASGVAVNSSGEAYVTGRTDSTDFPTKIAAQRALAGSVDSFLTKLNAAGTALAFSTYLGGSDFDEGTSIALDNSGNVYVTGRTFSDNFPAKSTFQATRGGGADTYVAKFNSTGSLAFSTYLGGVADENAPSRGIGVDASGNIYVTGDTASANYPTLSLQPNFGGGIDAFVTKISPAAATGADLSVRSTATPDTGTPGGNLTYSITVANHGPDNSTGLSLTDSLGSDVTFVSSAASQGSCSGTGPVNCSLGSLNNGKSATVTIVVNTPNGAIVNNAASVTANESDSSSGNNLAELQTVVNADFSVGVSPARATVKAGGSASFTFTVAAKDGPFISDISFTCSGLPQLAGCSFSPTSVNLGADASATTKTTVALLTTAPIGALSPNGRHYPVYAICLPLLGVVLTCTSAVRRRRWGLFSMTLLFLAVLQTSCGGSSGKAKQPGTPPGTYTITITATSGATHHSATADLTVQ